MRHSMPIPTEKSTPEEWLAYANWLRFTENARLAKKVTLFRETGNYVAVEDFLFEIEENEKEAQYIESKYAPIVEYDSVLNRNAFRKGRNRKAKQNGKRNADKAKRYHRKDRYHGKGLEPYLYKEDGIIKESIEWVWRDCRNPVSDRVKYSDNAMKAREQEYYSSYPVEDEAKEVEVAETTEEAGTFDDFLWRLVDELPEQKYIVLFSFDNGQSYEDYNGCTNEFRGVMTKDEVIAELTKVFLWNDCEVEIGETEVKGLKGAKFNWDFGCDKWGWNGYESFTIIPVSRLN